MSSYTPKKLTCQMKRDHFNKERLVFQPTFFRGKLLVLKVVNIYLFSQVKIITRDTQPNLHRVSKKNPRKTRQGFKPIGSMYGIFPYIYHQHQLNVGKYTIHGSYGKRSNATLRRNEQQNYPSVHHWVGKSKFYYPVIQGLYREYKGICRDYIGYWDVLLEVFVSMDYKL